MRMHIELKQQTEEKRRVEGLKFSISDYRLQQCLMQKKNNTTQKMPSCLFPKAWWETFPKAWWSLGNNSAEPGKRVMRKTTECVFKSLESRFFTPERIPAFSDRLERQNERERPAEEGMEWARAQMKREAACELALTWNHWYSFECS